MNKTEFGERLKGYRLAKGLSRTQVAAALGIGEKSYGNYETGCRTPNVLKLPKLAEVLGVTFNDLLSADINHKGAAV